MNWGNSRKTQRNYMYLYTKGILAERMSYGFLKLEKFKPARTKIKITIFKWFLIFACLWRWWYSMIVMQLLLISYCVCRRPNWKPKTQQNGSSAVVWLSFWFSTRFTRKKTWSLSRNLPLPYFFLPGKV